MLQCPHCDREFDRVSSVVIHLNSRRPGWSCEREYKCPLCDYETDKGVIGLTIHYSKVHQDQDCTRMGVLLDLCREKHK